MAKKLSEVMNGDGQEKQKNPVTPKAVKAAVEKLRSAQDKIAGPTGEKGGLVKKLRDDEGLDMGAIAVLAKLDSMSEDKRAAWWETFNAGIEGLDCGAPKDLFTDTNADDTNRAKKTEKIRGAVKEPASLN